MRPGQGAAGGQGQGPGECPVGRQAGARGSACILPSRVHRSQGCDSAPRPTPAMGTGPRLLGRRQKTTPISAPWAPGAGASTGLGVPALVEGLSQTISTGPRTLWAVALCPQGSPNRCPFRALPTKGQASCSAQAGQLRGTRCSPGQGRTPPPERRGLG